MKAMLVYNNSIIKDYYSPIIKKEFFAIPVIPIKVALKYDVSPTYNHFERAILSLLLNGKYYTVIEIAQILMLDNELVELIINSLIANGDLDDKRKVTTKAENTLKGLYKESKIVVKYAFYDVNRGRLLKETASPEVIKFQINTFNDYENYDSNNLDDYYRSFKVSSDTVDISIKFTLIDLGKEKTLDKKKIESSLNKKSFVMKDKSQQILISATIIDIIEQRHYLLSYVNTSLSTANTNRWNVLNPITLEGDIELQNFFYYANSNKVVQLIIEKLMKSRINIINEDVDKKRLYNLIKQKLFFNEISKKHELFIEPFVYVLDSISVKNENLTGQSGILQFQETLKMAMIYFGQLFENLLYQAASEYQKLIIEDLIGILTKDKDYNNITLTTMANFIGFDIGDRDLKIFNTTKLDLIQMFMLGKEYVLTACVAMNILIANSDKGYFLNRLSKSHKDAILKLDRLKSIRDEKRHTTDRYDVTIKDYLYIAFDIMDLAFGYKVNQKVLDEYFRSKVSLYDYSYSYEYIRNKVGSNFFDSKETKVIAIRQHLVEMHKKHIEHQSDYIASAHSIVEDLFKEILNYITGKSNIKIEFELKEHFADGYDFQKYIESIGFDTDIDKAIFNTDVHRALSIDPSRTERFIKSGFRENFDKATNRVKMQALILLLKLNKHVVSDFLSYKFSLKKIFKLTTIIMYLDRSHQQSTNYSEAQAEYVIEELLELIKNIYNNGKVINWRS